MTSISGATASAPASRKPRDDEIDVHGLTHVGKMRKTNNDHFLIGSLHKRMVVKLTSLPGLDRQPHADERLAFIAMVADGVGGSEKGGEASRLALEEVTQYLSTSLQAYYSADARDSAFTQALQEAASRCHASVQDHAGQRSDFRGMATTLTLWLGVWPWIYLLQVGDSRYYAFRDGTLTQVTHDQTMAQELLDRGALTAAEAERSHLAHVLSSSIGGRQTEPVVTRLQNDWRTVHLLCSDGLTKHVSDERIAQRLAAMTSARQVAEQLLQDALDDGGTDNITLIVARPVPKEPV